ncbi:hypothetical protein Plec18167_006489 [Paecilomyces lecythidis]|uniref:Uncharacterized protein n=1 Tax=Paecilomyces lecythidis TaxID=3004212 RepID=A0ABR3XB30_9EURO
MSMTRRLAQFEQGRELPGKPMAKSIEPSKKEEVVPWLWDFAYLYKPGGLNLDDGKSKESQIIDQKKKAAEAQNPAPDYPIKSWKAGISCSVWSVPDISMHPIFRNVPSCDNLYERANETRNQITVRVINTVARPAPNTQSRAVSSGSTEWLPYSVRGSQYGGEQRKPSKRSFISRLFTRVKEKTESLYHNYTSTRRTHKHNTDYHDRDVEAAGELLGENYEDNVPDVQPQQESLEGSFHAAQRETFQGYSRLAPQSVPSPEVSSPETVPPPYHSACEIPPPPQYSPSSTALPLQEPSPKPTITKLVSKVWSWIWGSRAS